MLLSDLPCWLRSGICGSETGKRIKTSVVVVTDVLLRNTVLKRAVLV